MKITLNNTSLRFVEEEDAAFILELRTNETLSRFLNKTDNNVEKQRQWLKAYKDREKAGAEFYFIIENSSTAEPLGTVRIYNIINNQYTSGSWIVKKGVNEEAAFISDFLVTYYGFEVIGCEGCFFDVRKDNKKVLRFHQRFADYVKEDEENYYLLMNKEGYQKKKDFFKQLLCFTDASIKLQAGT